MICLTGISIVTQKNEHNIQGACKNRLPETHNGIVVGLFQGQQHPQHIVVGINAFHHAAVDQRVIEREENRVSRGGGHTVRSRLASRNIMSFLQ